MYRVLVGGISHETNTFSPIKTDLEDFGQYLAGPELVTQGMQTKNTLGAFVQTLAAQKDVQIVPAVYTSAVPSGIVTRRAFSTLLDKLLEPLQEGPVDAVLLGMHGAMYSEIDADADGYILEKLRERVGPKAVIGVSVDLHVNLSQRMLDCVDILVPYKKYPHSDIYETSLLAAELTMKTLRKEITPVVAWKKIPIIPSLKDTNAEDYRPIHLEMEKWEAAPQVQLATVVHGFFMSDSRDTRMASLVITDGNASLAEQAAEALAQCAWDNRESLVRLDCYSVEQAYAEAMENQKFPVVFADVCDNPGAGGTCDTVHILRYLLQVKAQRVFVGMITDAESAQACHDAGVGATVHLRLGNKAAPEITGEPLEVTGYVKTLSDGEFTNYGPMYTGQLFHLGKMAAVEIGGVTVVISSRKNQVYDKALFLSLGLDPERCDILVVKSSVHYKAAFGPMSQKNYSIEAPGLYTLNMHELPYTQIEKDCYPFSAQ